MLKLTPWLGLPFLLSSCSLLAAQQPLQLSSVPSSSPPNSPIAASPIADVPTPMPDVQCSGSLPKAVEPSMEQFRLAKKSDFIPEVQEFKQANSPTDFTCSIFTADFDDDGDRDYALLLVNDETKKFRAQFSLNKGNDTFEPLVLRTYPTLPASGQSPMIYTSMEMKPKGEGGLALRDYSPLQGRDRETYTEKPAIALWRAILTDDEGLPADFNISTLAYCSDAYYFVKGQLETFSVCD